jgi:hypothetical protein
MGRKTAKTTGQSGIISCSRAREYFYDFACCELSSEGRYDLSRHEESCPVCGPEFKEWRRLRSVLQSSGRNAAIDFKAGVMARIKETRQEPATRRFAVWGAIRQHGWARGLAAAAVILIMLSGAAKLPAGESLIAHLTGQNYVAFNPTSPTRPVTPAEGQRPVATNPGGATSPAKADKPGTVASDSGAPKVLPTQPKPTTDSSEVPPATDKNPDPGTPGEFTVSSKSMVMTTTTLKIAVGNLTQARSAALNIASNYGAGETSEQSTEDGHSSLLFIHFAVDRSMAGIFLNHLSSLGGVLSEGKTNDDVTGDYTRTLNAYRALLAQQSAADSSEKNQYTSQIGSLESELQNWSDVSGKQAVMLWLVQ